MDTCPHVSPQASPNRFLKVAKGVCLPPLSETVVLASCSLQGTHFLESLDQLYDRKKVTLSNGVANLRSNVQLRVRVANFSDKAVYLHKNEKLGIAIPAPMDIMTIEAESPASDINKASPGNPEDKGGQGLGPLPFLQKTITSPKRRHMVSMTWNSVIFQNRCRRKSKMYSDPSKICGLGSWVR